MKKLESYSCLVSVQNGKLCQCKLAQDGSPEFSAGSLTWTEIREPVEQEFLDAVNKALGTSFALGDFNKRPAKKTA